MANQRAPLFTAEIKGGLGKKDLSRLMSLVFEGEISGFTFRLWSTCQVGIKHVNDLAKAKADEGWQLDGESTFYIDPLCERVLKCLAGQAADVDQIRWRAATRYVGNDILLEIQLEPD